MLGLFLTTALVIGAVEHGETTFRATVHEDRVPERFRLSSSVFSYELEPLRDAGNYTVTAVRFPSPVVSPDPVNNTVHAEYFVPAGAGAARGRGAGRR